MRIGRFGFRFAAGCLVTSDNSATPPPTPTATNTLDVESIIEARVRSTVAAIPTPTPECWHSFVDFYAALSRAEGYTPARAKLIESDFGAYAALYIANGRITTRDLNAKGLPSFT